eukprot:m.64215 g.64215  ORF g.64215 m.64215 type:complete len:228 (+) comp11631_c0_seq1:3807-4490(+)
MFPSSIREKLTTAYHICAHLGLDDHTYTHLSARGEDGKSFYIYPFGLRFEEVTPDNLLQVSLDGHVLSGREEHYNITGYYMHGSLYQERPDLNAIFHLHTPAIIAVSSIKQGLMPLSQWALHFYGRVAYHPYDSLVLSKSQSDTIAQNSGNKKVFLLQNHGATTCGSTLEEAMFYTYHLEQACETQCRILSMNQPVVEIDPKYGYYIVCDRGYLVCPISKRKTFFHK